MKNKVHQLLKKAVCIAISLALLAGFSSVLAESDGEVGPDDFRISNMGPNSDPNYWAGTKAVAYNYKNNEFLVIWPGRTTGFGLYESEVFGQRIDADTAQEIGTNDFRISEIGPDDDTNFQVGSLGAIVFNPERNEYLVVWSSDSSSDDEYEVYGQLLDANGDQIGPNDFRISDMGPEGNNNYVAHLADAVYNPVTKEYLVVWAGCDVICDDENGIFKYEIFGQRIDALTGLQIGENDFRISDVSPGADLSYTAYDPAVAYNSDQNEFLVVWNERKDGAITIYTDIYGQRLNSIGAEIGVDDFKISNVGTNLTAYAPDLSYNSVRNEYIVVWIGTNYFGYPSYQIEIFGQLLDGAGAEIGVNDFRISDMGPDSDPGPAAFNPDVFYSFRTNEYMVVWHGFNGPVYFEYEIYGQMINATTGSEVGNNDFQLSKMGPDGSQSYGGLAPAISYSFQSNLFLVVWEGDDNTPPLVDNEFEIFGQLYESNTPLPQLDELVFLPVIKK